MAGSWEDFPKLVCITGHRACGKGRRSQVALPSGALPPTPARAPQSLENQKAHCRVYQMPQQCESANVRNVELRKLYPNVTRSVGLLPMLPLGVAAGRYRPGRRRAVLPERAMPRKLIIFNRSLTLCRRPRRRTRSCCYLARRARTRSPPRAASGP